MLANLATALFEHGRITTTEAKAKRLAEQEGIDVRFYGGLGGAFNRGFAISDDLLRSGGYSGETLTLTIPAGHSLDEMDGISLWCVAAGISFGEGQFM